MYSKQSYSYDYINFISKSLRFLQLSQPVTC